jgi:malonyl-CoA O-methyltransferase
MARLQQQVGERLLKRLDHDAFNPQVVLDLGCGTGYFRPALLARFPRASYVGLDIAEGMIDYARGQAQGAGAWLVGDAEDLPFASESVDLIFSSLAIQWCYHPRRLMSELARVLKPGGKCVFTTLGPQTLKELRAAWAAVDGDAHVNDFLPGRALLNAVPERADATFSLDAELYTMTYDRVRELLDELKGIGAHNMNRERRQGLTSRRALQGMLKAYESWRVDDLLPATYEVFFGELCKS